MPIKLYSKYGSTLKDILNKEGFILFDSSILFSFDLLGEIYDYRRYQNLDEKNLQKAKEELYTYIEFLNDEKVFVIKEVVEELDRVKRILSEKAKTFNDWEDYMIRVNKETSKRVEEKRSEFNEICLLTNNVVKTAKKSLYKPEDKDRYEKFVKAVKFATKDLKRPVHRIRREPRRYRREYEYLGTDEKIIAALYNASFEGHPPVAVSRDSGLCKILVISYNTFASEKLYPYNKLFLEKIEENPIGIYLSTKQKDMYNLATSTKKIPKELNTRIEYLTIQNLKDIFRGIK